MSEMHPETIYSVNSLFQQILDDDADDASLRYFGSLLESRTITEKELEEILLELK